MPLYVPKNLPAIKELRSQGITIYDEVPEGVKPLRILLLNLMPIKAVTELDISRQLSKTDLPVQLIPMKIRGQQYKNTPQEHMDAFYRNFDELASQQYEGMIVTGAPVERIPFESVRYWQQLIEIFDWSRTHVTSTVYICWAALAGLYHNYGIPKHILKKKISGVFKHHVLDKNNPLFRGFDDTFYVPHSRHCEIRKEDIQKESRLHIMAESEESGVYIIMARNGREIYITGHSEYSPYTLDYEYRRDLAKGLSPSIPDNYYQGDNPENAPLVRWRSHANLLFSNWLNYFVYQETPFDIREIK